MFPITTVESLDAFKQHLASNPLWQALPEPERERHMSYVYEDIAGLCLDSGLDSLTPPTKKRGRKAKRSTDGSPSPPKE